MLEIRQHVADHGEHDKYFCGKEDLTFVASKRAEAEECPDRGKLREAYRARCTREDCAETADFVQVGLQEGPRLIVYCGRPPARMPEFTSPAHGQRNGPGRWTEYRA